MLSQTCPTSLSPLVEYLDGLSARATITDLQRLLGEIAVTPDDLNDYIVFDRRQYRRNLICEGRWYELLAICWRSGQRSPIHNHAASTCGMRVLRGVVTETIFEHTSIGQVKAMRSIDRHEGDVCASADSDTHQISNLQPPGHDLITLHIYSPPLRKMDQFSITGEPNGIYRPVVHEFSGGSGI